MDFNEAFILAQAGQKIRRECWDNGHYISFNTDQSEVLLHKDEHTLVMDAIMIVNVLATDWEVYTPKKVIELTAEKFKKLITLGDVQVLEGTITDYYVKNLYFNESGKIRPPVNLMKDNEVIRIEEIGIMTKNGSELGFDEVASIVSIM